MERREEKKKTKEREKERGKEDFPGGPVIKN